MGYIEWFDFSSTLGHGCLIVGIFCFSYKTQGIYSNTNSGSFWKVRSVSVKT